MTNDLNREYEDLQSFFSNTTLELDAVHYWLHNSIYTGRYKKSLLPFAGYNTAEYQQFHYISQILSAIKIFHPNENNIQAHLETLQKIHLTPSSVHIIIDILKQKYLTPPSVHNIIDILKQKHLTPSSVHNIIKNIKDIPDTENISDQITKIINDDSNKHSDQDHFEIIETTTQWVSFNLAIGEGAVAGVAMAQFLVAAGIPMTVLPLSLSIIIGLCGAFCNYYLVHKDTKDLLNEIFVEDIFSTLKKESALRYHLAIFFGASALATGFAYAALSATQLFYCLVPALLSAHISASIAFPLAVTIACLPVLFTATGLASIFFIVITNFFKEKQWEKVAKYFNQHFLNLTWNDKNLTEKAAQFAESVFKITMMLLGLAVNIIITLVSFGVFYKSGVNILSAFADANVAQLIAYILTAINIAIAFIFNAEKINTLFAEYTLENIYTNTLALPQKILNGLQYSACGLLSVIFGIVTTLWRVLCDFPQHFTHSIIALLSYSIQLIIYSISQVGQHILSLPCYTLALIPGLLYVATTLIKCALTLLTSALCIAACCIGQIDPATKLQESLLASLDKINATLSTAIKAILQYPKNWRALDELQSICCRLLDQICDIRVRISQTPQTEHSTIDDQQKLPITPQTGHSTNNDQKTLTIKQGLDQFFVRLRYFTYGTILLNGIGQAMLMLGGAGILTRWCRPSTANSLACISQFLVSAIPNRKAADEALDEKWQQTTATA